MLSPTDSAVKLSPSSPLSCAATMMIAVADVNPLVTDGDISSTRKPDTPYTIHDNLLSTTLVSSFLYCVKCASDAHLAPRL